MQYWLFGGPFRHLVLPSALTRSISKYMSGFLEQWERARLEAIDLRPAGDTVVSHVALHSTGRTSGIEGDIRFFILFTFRGGRIVRIECVMDEADALEAAGLRE